MPKAPAIPPIPALSVKHAHQLEAIEHELSRALEGCVDGYGEIHSLLKAETYLQAYTVRIFDFYVGSYSGFMDTHLKAWLPDLKMKSIEWVIHALANFSGVTREMLREQFVKLSATVDTHLTSIYGTSPNPLLAGLAESPPAQASPKLVPLPPLPPNVREHMDAAPAYEAVSRATNDDYAKAGVDMSSASPLLIMAHAATHGAKTTPAKRPRLSASIHSPSAASKMEAYMKAKGLNQTEFAITADTTDKTIRKFRQTGQVKRSILGGIAKAMGTTREELLS
ncbi:hypothetical protein [Granulicella sp. L46]|uniref:hypothetical protein n=1 Tax=Granulicella sp. L46 TaxID=1641865 RepID=UPI00131CA3D2|nr:hypothetical protein [Granulicella sp. L46]